MFRFDLKTPVVPEGQRVYMLHPGKNYHLFKKFIDNECISTDLPNLKLKDGVSPKAVRSLDAQIKRARALRDWLALSANHRKREEYSLKLDDYSVDPTRRFHESYKETLTQVLWDLPAGTRIFVPNPAFNKDGFFCELKNATEERIEFNGPRVARDFTYVGRPVRNIQSVSMRLVPPEVFENKSRTTILTELDYHESEKLFRLYYGSFSIPGSLTQTEVDIPSEVFRPADANVINGLANFLEENLQRLERGETKATSFYDALFLAFEEAELQIHARLNSKGIFQIAAKTVAPALLALFISVPATMSDDAFAKILKQRNVEVENTSCPDDKEFPRLIEDRLYGIIDMLGEKDISDICKRVRDFKKRTGAKVGSTLSDKDGQNQ